MGSDLQDGFDKIDLSKEDEATRATVRTPHAVSLIADNLPSPDIPDADLHFLSAYRGEQDLGKLRAHALRVWRKAMKYYAYRCIRDVTFLADRIVTHPSYPAVLERRRSLPLTTRLPFLDLGTCFGNDLRKLTVDGFPREDLVGLDVERVFWDCGVELFDAPISEGGSEGPVKDTSGFTYILGDILDDAFLPPESPASLPSQTSASSDLPLPFPISRDYEPPFIPHLRNHFSFIHAGSLLHLFSRSTLPTLLAKTRSLLRPGGLFFGRTVGIPGDADEGTDVRDKAAFGEESQLGYLNTQRSLKSLLELCGFVDVWVDGMASRRGKEGVQGGGKPARTSRPAPERDASSTPTGPQLKFLLFSARKPDEASTTSL